MYYCDMTDCCCLPVPPTVVVHILFPHPARRILYLADRGKVSFTSTQEMDNKDFLFKGMTVTEDEEPICIKFVPWTDLLNAPLAQSEELKQMPRALMGKMHQNGMVHGNIRDMDNVVKTDASIQSNRL